jgi:RNA polymerase sigma factor (sigma-70 family)
MSSDRPDFPQTRWSLILGAAGEDRPKAEAALAELFQRYKSPLYAFLRRPQADRPGKSREDAEDIVQGFFLKLIEKNWLGDVDQSFRFRSFLLVSLKHFTANEWRRGQAQRRGGSQKLISLDDAEAAYHVENEAATDQGPEEFYDRHFALELLRRVMASLRLEYERTGQAELFSALKPNLSGNDHLDETYVALAARLGLTVPAIKSAMSRLRKRYRDLLWAEVRDIVPTEAEVAPELRYLLGIFSKASGGTGQ